MELQDWKFIQNNADSILIGGISSLESQPIIKKDNIFFQWSWKLFNSFERKTDVYWEKERFYQKD
ncbi:hypothetical protein [Sphingobacterium daejeonense]|uniref:hypothetical protein n=1 Tax=Sphingobacterium daejeonense TaxID=371142 RepID=UPI0010C3AEA3|nr:hypothetical protein [Sphingobacterium daejeonense]VTQ01785.1 Uncharacterised protein [Sphingobacterium daejeonense]